MAETFTIEPDEFLGLSALVDLGRAANGSGAGTVTEAKTLMRRALADKLEDAGLPWAPSAEAVKRAVAEAAEPPSGTTLGQQREMLAIDFATLKWFFRTFGEGSVVRSTAAQRHKIDQAL